MKHAIMTLTAALLGAAGAQEIATSLPLTSIGQELMWTVGDQDLKLVVGVSSHVQLDIYGGQFDPQDYRKPVQFGDENYSTATPKLPVDSTFTLTDINGKVIKEHNYGAGEQDWQTFISQDLPAGNYTLKVRTEGKGKNTFAFRLNSISAAVQTNHLNVTIRSNDWVPALNVYNPGGKMTVRMYDGDGPKELQAELRDAAGNAYPIKVSGQLQWDTIDVPEAKGNYTVYLRQPQHTYQFSNSVGFELASGPITVVQADTTGKLDIRAELILPDEVRPTQANVTVGEQTYSVQGSAGPFSVPTHDYAVTAEPIKGAEVTVNTPSVTVVKQETAHVSVQVKPTVNLTFQADKPEVCVGDVVKFTAQATTEFERELLPASLQVALPAGLSADGSTTATAKVDAKNPGQLVFEAKAVTAGDGSAKATLLPWNKTQDLAIKVLPSATQIELRRADLADALPGDTVTVTLSLKNTSSVAAPYTLKDEPGESLEALDSTTFSGELKPGEEKTVSYKARVKGQPGVQDNLKATLSSNCASSQVVEGTLNVQTPPPPPAPVVAISRESTLRIPFDSPRSATQIIVAHQPPAGASYVPGSSALNGKAIADPQVAPSGKFYWTTPGLQRGVLTYHVTHTEALPTLSSPTLIGKYAQDKLEVLIGENTALTEARNLQELPVSTAENDGALKLPLAETVFRDRDRITVAVEGVKDDLLMPTVNGVEVKAATLGKTTTDKVKNTQRREFFGIPLQPGTNVVSYGGQTVKVYLASRPVTAELAPEQLVADGTTPVRVAIKLLDAAGLTSGSTVTVQTTREVTQQDARPAVASYQVKLKDGVGVVEMEPMSAPGRFDVRVLVGEKAFTRSFESLPSKTRVGIGMVSAGVLLSGLGQGNTALAGEAIGHGYLETPIGQGKLYVAGSGAVNVESQNGKATATSDRSQGLPTTANPLERYPTYGDSSTHDVPLEGIDPLAFRYEHPKFNLQYRQAQLPVNVFDTGVSPTALSGFTRSNPQVSGFVAAVPNDLTRVVLDPKGQRVLPLHLTRGTLQPDSETVELITVDHLTGAVTYKALQRLSDYTVDNAAGVIYFQKTVNLTDEYGNDQRVRVTYRLDDPMDQRQLAWGVQVGTRLMDNHLSLAAAAVHLDDVNSFGVRARYADDHSAADLLVATSGSGVLVNGTANIRSERLDASASVKYQNDDYKGLNSGGVGTAVTAKALYKVTDRIGVGVDGLYVRGATLTDPTTGITTTASNGGYVDVKGLYDLKPFSVGAGVRAGFGDQKGLGVVGMLGYSRNNVSVRVEHAQSLTGDLPSSTVAEVSVPVAQNVTLKATDTVRWGLDQRATVGLQARYGMTNLAVNYDLPGADGWGNRARFGVDTTLPINNRLGVGLTGSYILDLKGHDSGWNAGASLQYKDSQVTATLATDVSHRDDGFRVGLKGGAAYSLNDQLTVSMDATHVQGPQASDTGNNLAVSMALRASQWQGLAYLRYKDGALAGNSPEVIGEGNLEYHTPRYALRGGIAGRMLLNNHDSLTYQVSASGTYYVTDRIGLGLAGRALVQPGSNYHGYSAGIEASLRALPGTWVTLGYNPWGFTGIGSNLYTRQGAYVRIDMMLDDHQSNGVKCQAAATDCAAPAFSSVSSSSAPFSPATFSPAGQTAQPVQTPPLPPLLAPGDALPPLPLNAPVDLNLHPTEAPEPAGTSLEGK
ncbi:hypothetical protein [Deinococcus sp.]|uniref:hypothetical protein n=1 Tax=Deinococcus sp. TaxID=47478 RepID=UPI0025B83A3C|nr:hypothetical protein [Deinococcus sp.]